MENPEKNKTWLFFSLPLGIELQHMSNADIFIYLYIIYLLLLLFSLKLSSLAMLSPGISFYRLNIHVLSF